MKTILIGCSATKGRGPTVAKNLYTGTLFRYSRIYAEQSGQPWYILSAKYGLLHPERIVASYDQTLARKPDQMQFSMQVVGHLFKRFGDIKGMDFEILAGMNYRRFLVPALEKNGATVTVPMEGLPIGKQLNWLLDQIGEQT